MTDPTSAVDHDPGTCGDPSCAEVGTGAEWLDRFMSFDGGRVRFHHDDEMTELVAAARATRFAELTETYRTDPDDFVTCYQWLSTHPIFWRYRLPAAFRGDDIRPSSDADAAVTAVEVPRNLIDSDGLATVWMSVGRATTPDALGGPGARFLLEHGPHLFASDSLADGAAAVRLAGHSTHDHHLDVWGVSYEDAIVKLAARVMAVYGTDRSQVRHTGDTPAADS